MKTFKVKIKAREDGVNFLIKLYAREALQAKSIKQKRERYRNERDHDPEIGTVYHLVAASEYRTANLSGKCLHDCTRRKQGRIGRKGLSLKPVQNNRSPSLNPESRCQLIVCRAGCCHPFISLPSR